MDGVRAGGQAASPGLALSHTGTPCPEPSRGFGFHMQLGSRGSGLIRAPSQALPVRVPWARVQAESQVLWSPGHFCSAASARIEPGGQGRAGNGPQWLG